MDRKPVPYEILPMGIEAVYTDENPSEVKPDENVNLLRGFSQVTKFIDAEGRVVERWTVWNRRDDHALGEPWDDPDINFINTLQEKAGELSDETRKIRAHIGSFIPCDNGFPVTVDEILDAIGTGRLREPSFHNGCCAPARWWEAKTTQPDQNESMRVIEDVLKGYMNGVPEEDFLGKYPEEAGFIERTYKWLGPSDELSNVQRLLLERILLLFDFLTKRETDHVKEHKRCFGPDGEGKELDRRIAEAAGLPEIHPNYTEEYVEARDSIKDEEKRNLYRLCGALAHGLHELSDCHHSTFRWLETWIHWTGTMSPDIPTRAKGVERERLSQGLFGYVYALDKWLAGEPMQFVLLDLGHVDLGFDIKDEILRVYAYLGEERTPVKEWLAACLWYSLYKNFPAGLVRHKELLAMANEKGLSVREWIEA